jgi:uncharacterized protein (TIGR03382 family)
VDGACHGDAPCAFIECPRGTWCVAGACTDGRPSAQAEPQPGGAGGGAGGAGGAGGDGPEIGVPDAGVRDAAVLPPDAAPDATISAPPPADDGGCDASGRGETPVSPWMLLIGLIALRRRR